MPITVQAPSKVFSFSHGELTMHLRADCWRHTTNSDVTVTVTYGMNQGVYSRDGVMHI